MAIKDLLVQLDDGDACVARTEAAIRLAQAHDAHLTGLYLVPNMIVPVSVEGYLAPAVAAEIQEAAEARAQAAVDRFRAMAAREISSFETRIDRGTFADLASLFGLHGRYADLSIIGQEVPDEAVPSPLTPADVLLNSGGPNLVIPYIGAGATIGERVLIAWNASPEAARAVKNAMPILERAASVMVVSFNPRADSMGDLPGADIGLHLARHGIKVDVRRLDGRGIDVGNALLSEVADARADLLVMGAYSHSRLRELVLGGATRTILQSMTVPVLMTH